MSFLGKLFAPKTPTIVMPQAPTPQPVAPMPDSDSVEIRRAKQQELSRRMARGGRQSTILSDGGGGVGGDNFGSSRLGG